MRYPHLKALALSLAIGAVSGPVLAQDYAFGWNPRTGDVWVDQRLGDINSYGARYRDPFVDEMVRYHRAPRDLVLELLTRRNWAPGDVYYACSIANVLGLPCRNVVDEWDRDHGQGWGVVAQRMGIKPGSAEFHRLKKGFVPSYDRWGRPVVLDRDLERAYPDRGKKGRSMVRGNGQPSSASAATPPTRGKAKGQPSRGGGKSSNAGGPSGKASAGRGKGQANGKGKG